MHSLRTKLLFFLLSELHPTYFNNKLSHDKVIEKCLSEHVQKKKKERKDERKCKLQKKEENKARTIILNCRNVKGGWNLSICPLLNPYAPRRKRYRVLEIKKPTHCYYYKLIYIDLVEKIITKSYGQY